jgi:hypothetical protein
MKKESSCLRPRGHCDWPCRQPCRKKIPCKFFLISYRCMNTGGAGPSFSWWIGQSSYWKVAKCELHEQLPEFQERYSSKLGSLHTRYQQWISRVSEDCRNASELCDTARHFAPRGSLTVPVSNLWDWKHILKLCLHLFWYRSNIVYCDMTPESRNSEVRTDVHC